MIPMTKCLFLKRRNGTGDHKKAHLPPHCRSDQHELSEPDSRYSVPVWVLEINWPGLQIDLYNYRDDGLLKLKALINKSRTNRHTKKTWRTNKTREVGT